MDATQLNDLRLRIDAGQEVSNEEILAGLKAIRSDRAIKVAESGTKASKRVTVNVGKIDLAALIAARTTKPSG